jgi:hypothetical protein
MMAGLTRRSLLLSTASAAAASVLPFGLGGCGGAAVETTLEASPLVGRLLRTVGSEFAMQVGTLAADAAAGAVFKDIAPALKKLQATIRGDHSTSVLDEQKIVYLFARTVTPTFASTNPLFLVTALWRQSDGRPASRVVSGSGSAVVDIPTPAQLGIALLAQRRTAAWIDLLEQQGQCVSDSDIALRSAALFAPSRSADVMSGGVPLPSVTSPAQYRFWTADGGRVIVDWHPSVDPKSDARTTVDVSYTPGQGFELANVPGLPTESHDSFAFSDIWAQADKDSVPVIDLGKPLDLNQGTTLPIGQGTLHGTLVVAPTADARYRVVSISCTAAGEINGSVYISMTGFPRGTADVDPVAGLPITLSVLPGGCAYYSGSMTKTGTVLRGVLSGPAGIVNASIQYTPDQGVDQFFGILTLTPQAINN